MSVFTRESLLAATASAQTLLPLERIHVPELGGDLVVRGMTGTERDEFESSLTVGLGRKRRLNTVNIRARLLVKCLCDASGNRLLLDEDVDALGKLPAKVLAPLFDAAQRLSGVSDEDIDELGKSSGKATPSDDSSST